VSKSAVEMYSDILRLEMRKWDVRVSIIEPQACRTGLLILYYSAFIEILFIGFGAFIVICKANVNITY